MKIKIVRRADNDETVYDVYAGFTGLPTTWPFCTKWVRYMTLNKEELLKWLKKVALDPQKVIIKI